MVKDKTETVDTRFAAIHYVRAEVRDHYQQLTVDFRGDFGVVFRAYDDAVAYRFVTRKRGELVVKNEEAHFNFAEDHPAFIPYLWDYRGGQIDTWYVGAMTNWTPRDLTIDLSFLKSGPYEALAFADGINADREGTDYKKTVGPVSAGEKLKVRLAPGGGWAAILSRK